MNAIIKWINYLFFCWFIIFCYLVIGCSKKNQDKSIDDNSKIKDSISVLIKQSSKKDIDLNIKKKKLLQAYNLSINCKVDSIKNKFFKKIAYDAYKLNDSALFNEVNKRAYLLSKKLNDTAGVAKCHWNYASHYVNKEVYDSAYYYYNEAEKLYDAINDDISSARILYNMAFVQGRLNGYTESEQLLFHAIKKFKPLQKYKNLYLCYNELGIIFAELEDFKMAISYHKKALSYLEMIDNKGYYREWSLNNLSLVYGRQSNYKVAIAYLDDALKRCDTDKEFKKTNTYARLIDNRAYFRFLSGDTTNVLKELQKSLQIRDSLNNESGIVINNLHLAEFYVANKDTLKAIEITNEAYKFAKKLNNNRDKLVALKLFSVLDKVNSNKFLNEYISLVDSLQNQERKMRNKFARIRFETDKYIKKTQRLSEQQSWILIMGFFIIFIFSLLYYIVRQQSKNKALIFEQNQQISNEEIYSLILKQQLKLEEGRIEERNRISEELHDGVLGKLFGTRMGLGFLNISGDDATIQKYQSHIEAIQQIEKEIRSISRKLKSEVLFSNSNFLVSVKELVSKQSEISKFKYVITSDDKISWNEIDEKIKINFYRILQETIQNINKYSKATNVTISFSLNRKMLILTIEDDGIGFDIEKKKKKKGIGLKNMLSRAEKLDGKFSVNSIINKGTVITISIPI